MMTLFEMPGRREGSLLIEEYPAGAPFTKRVEVCFDGRGGRTLVSPRARELRRLLQSNRFQIVDQN